MGSSFGQSTAIVFLIAGNSESSEPSVCGVHRPGDEPGTKIKLFKQNQGTV